MTRGTPMYSMRPDTCGAAACVALLPWWVWVTGLNTDPFWLVVFCLIVGVGVGCGLSGVRRGGRRSRLVSAVCLALLLAAGVLYTAASRRDLWADCRPDIVPGHSIPAPRRVS